MEKEDWKKQSIESFKNAVIKSEGRCVVCSVIVSKSGMSRRIKFQYWNNEFNAFSTMYAVLEDVGYNVLKDGYIRVNGCGMNMIWNTLYGIYTHLGIENANSIAERYTVL